MANFATDGSLCMERELHVTHSDEEFGDLIQRFEIIETCKWITFNNFSKVCLQFPDGLLSLSAKVYEEIKRRVDVDLYILGDTSYSSCCVDSVAAMHVQADAVVHYGHTCFSKSNIAVYVVLPKKELDIEGVMKHLQEQFQSDNDDKLCLFYGPEYEYLKDALARQWYMQYPRSYVAFVEVEDGPDRYMARLIRDVDGKILPVESLKDCTCIHIGSRGQTLFNFTITIEAKAWYVVSDQNKVEHLDESAWFKRRRFLVEKCKDAATVGILVCKLSGDQTKSIICHLKQLCRVNEKKSYIISVGKPNVAKLANFPEIDIYVLIACPENDLYGERDFYRPIVYPYELELALNSSREPYFNTHITDFDQLLPGKRHYCDIEHIKQETDVSLITGRIRKTRVNTFDGNSTELAENQNWALENIGHNLQNRSWIGLEQKLGETEVKVAEEGRKGIPLQYSNEPE